MLEWNKIKCLYNYLEFMKILIFNYHKVSSNWYYFLQEQADKNVCLTIENVKDALDQMRGAVTIVYPMGLPPHDPIRLEFENNEDLSGTQVRHILVLSINPFSLSCIVKFSQLEPIPFTEQFFFKKILLLIFSSLLCLINCHFLNSRVQNKNWLYCHSNHTILI